MHNRSKRLAAYVRQIQARVHGVIYQADHCYIVASDDMEAEYNLLDSRRCGKDALMALINDDVDGLIETLQRAYEVPSIRRDN